MAASRSAIKAGAAFVELYIDDSKFLGKLRSIGAGFATVGTAALAAGTVITAAFGTAAKIFADVGSALFDMSQRTNESVESLSELTYAAEQTGTSIEAIEKAINKARADGKSFEELAAQIASIKDPAQQSQRAIELFGVKLGPQLVPMIRNLKELREEARRLGIVMSSEDAAAADRLGDAMAAVRMQANHLFVVIGAAVAGPLADFLEDLSEFLPKLFEWISANKTLVQTVAVLGVALVGLGSALLFVAVAFKAAAIAGGMFAAVIIFLSKHPIIRILMVIATVLLAIATAAGAVKLAFGDWDKAADEFKKGGKLDLDAITGGAGGASISRSQFGGRLAEQRFGASANSGAKLVSISEKMLNELVEIKRKVGGMPVGTG